MIPVQGVSEKRCNGFTSIFALNLVDIIKNQWFKNLFDKSKQLAIIHALQLSERFTNTNVNEFLFCKFVKTLQATSATSATLGSWPIRGGWDNGDILVLGSTNGTHQTLWDKEDIDFGAKQNH